MNLGMSRVCIVWHWQTARIEDFRLRAHRLQEPRRFICQETAVGACPHRTIEQQDAGLMGRSQNSAQCFTIYMMELIFAHVGEFRHCNFP